MKGGMDAAAAAAQKSDKEGAGMVGAESSMEELLREELKQPEPQPQPARVHEAALQRSVDAVASRQHDMPEDEFLALYSQALANASGALAATDYLTEEKAEIAKAKARLGFMEGADLRKLLERASVIAGRDPADGARWVQQHEKKLIANGWESGDSLGMAEEVDLTQAGMPVEDARALLEAVEEHRSGAGTGR